MKDEKRTATGQANGSLPNRILGSLRDALNAASRDDRSGEITLGDKGNQLAANAAPDPRKPAVLAPAGEDGEIIPGYRYLIMPIRIGS